MLTAKLIKAFYQHTPSSLLSDKAKNYLHISQTLWNYLQGEETLSPSPTISDVRAEGSAYILFERDEIAPRGKFPPLS